MPKIRFELRSQRGRNVDDRVRFFLLRRYGSGYIRDDRNIHPSSKRFTVNVRQGKHRLQLEIPGFRAYNRDRMIHPSDSSDVIPYKVVLTHRCKRLPTVEDLQPEQTRLLGSVDPGVDLGDVWSDLSDNQCATFYQVSLALSQTTLISRTFVSEYIDSIDRIGGAQITNDIPDGKDKRVIGWRMHVRIQSDVGEDFERDLVNSDWPRNSSVHSTHKRFGFKKSYREEGALPHLQVVLNEDNDMADVDLDVEFHRSAPHSVYKHLRSKFPDIEGIFEY